MTEPLWIAEGRKLIGLQEKEGALNEPRVVELFAEAGIPEIVEDETAWCGAFATAMFARAGRRDVRPPGDRYNALRAREWLKVGRPVDPPELGDIAVFKRGTSPTQGHVAFYVGETEKYVKVLGGNQSNSVSIAQYLKSNLLGYRRVDPATPAAPRSRPQSSPPIRRPEPAQAVPDPEDATRGDDRPPGRWALQQFFLDLFSGRLFQKKWPGR